MCMCVFDLGLITLVIHTRLHCKFTLIRTIELWLAFTRLRVVGLGWLGVVLGFFNFIFLFFNFLLFFYFLDNNKATRVNMALLNGFVNGISYVVVIPNFLKFG